MMKHAMTYTAGIIGLAIGLVATTAVAQTTAAGPYYATPSWDQTLPAATRFIVLSNFNNDAVLDRETGLVWTRSPNDPFNYFNARARCIGLRTGNRGGWRLPASNELSSLFDVGATSFPGLPAGHPFTNLPSADATYWTTTPLAPVSRWTVSVLQSATGIVVLINTSVDEAVTGVYSFCVRSAVPGV